MNLLNRIKEELKSVGIVDGDAVIVHSALGSLGKFPDKDRIVTDALLETVGSRGTLLMPSLSYENVTRENPFFSINKTPSCVGWLTEYFRNLQYSQRSIHPTHSVSATGSNTDFLTGRHQLDNTPCGNNSPFSLLRELKGKILFLGCSLKANTSMHGIEELSEPEYLFDEEIEYSIETGNGKTYNKKYIPHNFRGFEQRYDRVLDILHKDDYSHGEILEADVYLLKTKPLWSKAHEKLCEDPLYFVDRIPPIQESHKNI